jgi:hypothetical protein
MKTVKTYKTNRYDKCTVETCGITEDWFAVMSIDDDESDLGYWFFPTESEARCYAELLAEHIRRCGDWSKVDGKLHNTCYSLDDEETGEDEIVHVKTVVVWVSKR